MRWTAHISILFALAAASASATVPSTAPTRPAAQATAPQNPAKDGPAAAHRHATKPPKGSSKTFAEGYRKGYAAGRAVARQQASAHCPAPAEEHQAADIKPPAVLDEPDATLPPSIVARHAAPSVASNLPPVPRNGPTPAPMRGSYSSLERQNVRLEEEGLERIEDQRDLQARIANKLLVPLPASEGLAINPKLPANRRYCRPWTAHFLSDLAQAHEALFHQPLEVNSAVRTVAYQKLLRLANNNAAPAKGDVVSPHLTGSAVDIAKEQLPSNEIAWLRRQLLPLQKAGKIDVEEEFQQACFHITVYKSYEAAKPHPKPVQPAQQRIAAHSAASANQPAPSRPPAAQPMPTSARPAPKKQPARAPTEVIVSGQ
jgi:hypothetical protein